MEIEPPGLQQNGQLHLCRKGAGAQMVLSGESNPTVMKWLVGPS